MVMSAPIFGRNDEVAILSAIMPALPESKILYCHLHLYDNCVRRIWKYLDDMLRVTPAAMYDGVVMTDLERGVMKASRNTFPVNQVSTCHIT